MRTLIMAAGKGERWKVFGDTKISKFKQLVPVYNRPLINHLTNSLDKFGIPHAVVASNEELAEQIGPCKMIKETNSVVESIYEAKSLWLPSMVILLGDTLYDNIDLGIIYRKRKGLITFYGNQNEIAGLQINGDPTELFKYVITNFKHNAHYNSRRYEGKLRDLRYIHKFNALPFPKHFNEREDRNGDPNFVFLEGYTTDVDHALGYRKVLRSKEIMKALQAT